MTRYESGQPGITTWHQFSAGAHYDPDNIAFGPVVGLDEHLVDPGAGFDWHGHRGVHIVSWILEGMLRHEDSNGVARVVGPGVLLVQSTDGGIRHRETNASGTASLRFLQVTILGDEPASVRMSVPPTSVAGVAIAVVRDRAGAADDARTLVTPLEGSDERLVLTLPA